MSGGKGWKRLDTQAKMGERATSHKLPDHRDAISKIGHIERETAQGKRSSMQS